MIIAWRALALRVYSCLVESTVELSMVLCTVMHVTMQLMISLCVFAGAYSIVLICFKTKLQVYSYVNCLLLLLP